MTILQNDGFSGLRIYCIKLNPAWIAFLQIPEPEESVWSENRCLAVNKLGSMMKELSKAANLS